MFDIKNDNLELRLWKELTNTASSLEKAHIKRVSHFKLTTPQFDVLELLNSAGPMPLKEVSKKLGVTGANITCVMDNLEKQHFAERVPSKTDRRIIRAEITAGGKKILNAKALPYLESITEATSKLTDDEKAQLLDLLKKLKG